LPSTIGNKPESHPEQNKMSGKILNTVPISGEYPEIHFGEHFTHRLWVEFEDNSFLKWISCFPNDFPKILNKVLINNHNNTAFVVSGGVGYLIDINKRELRYKTEEQPLIESAILTENPDYFIAGTIYSVYVLDSEKLVKEVKPNFMVDGIYFKSQRDKKASGDLATAENQYDFNIDFEFDLETFDLTLNKKVIRKQFGLFESIRVVDKDWKNKPNIFKRLIHKLIK
jgi:hypothetical protein